jgi:hypothetical protein
VYGLKLTFGDSMVAVAMIALNLFHPGLCFNDRRAQRSVDEKGNPEMSDEANVEMK